MDTNSTRRQYLTVLVASGITGLAGCGGSDDTSTSTTGTSTQGDESTPTATAENTEGQEPGENATETPTESEPESEYVSVVNTDDTDVSGGVRSTISQISVLGWTQEFSEAIPDTELRALVTVQNTGNRDSLLAEYSYTGEAFDEDGNNVETGATTSDVDADDEALEPGDQQYFVVTVPVEDINAVSRVEIDISCGSGEGVYC